MAGEDGLSRITDKNIRELTEAPRAALILASSDCGHCANYEGEILELRERGELQDVEIGKLVLDEPGSTQFKKQNGWISSLDGLPYTLLFTEGTLATHFAASKGTYLKEKVETSLAESETD